MGNLTGKSKQRRKKGEVSATYGVSRVMPKGRRGPRRGGDGFGVFGKGRVEGCWGTGVRGLCCYTHSELADHCTCYSAIIASKTNKNAEKRRDYVFQIQ